MRSKIKKYLTFIGLSIIIFSCQTGHDKLTAKEKRIIKNCINYIKENNEHGMNDEYIVDPYFNHFVISNFFDSTNKEFVRLFEKKSKKEYENIQDRLNKTYAGIYNEDLLSLSSSNSTNFIMSFSGIGENTVIGYLSYNSEKVSKLTDMKKFEADWNSTSYFIFIFDNQGNIEEVITTIATKG